MTNPYGRISGHLMHARELLEQRQPTSPTEELLLKMARFHLDAALLMIRKIHHGLRWWRP